MKTLGKILKAIGKTLSTVAGIVVVLIAIAVWSIVVRFVYDYQWIVLPMDVFVAILFAIAMKKTVRSGRLSMEKNKWFMSLFVFSTALLLLASFGAAWNFIVILFLLPISLGISMSIIRKK